MFSPCSKRSCSLAVSLLPFAAYEAAQKKQAELAGELLAELRGQRGLVMLELHAVEPVEAIFFYGTPLRTECETDHDLGFEMMRRMAEVLIKRLQATRRELLHQAAFRPPVA